MTGQCQATLSPHARRFDKQDLSSRWSPGQAGYHTGDAGALGHFGEELPRAEKLGEVLQGHPNRIFPPLSTRAGNFTTHPGNSALQIAQSGFTRVPVDHAPNRLWSEGNLLRLQSVLFELFRNEVPLRNGQLLLFR